MWTIKQILNVYKKRETKYRRALKSKSKPEVLAVLLLGYNVVISDIIGINPNIIL